MEGFDENDAILSLNSSELIEESVEGSEKVEEDSTNDEEIEYYDADDPDDLDSSAPDSYDGVYPATKRLKTSDANENSFKFKVMKILKKTSEVAGDFAISGKLDRTPLIVISLKSEGDEVDDVIRFPLNENEVPKFIKYFERSPYGKGAETIIDATVRNSFQLSPEGFEITNPEWDNFVKTVLVDHIKNAMTLECSFVPSLYKLLLYQPGSFFKSHRDSEKEENMFGTLVVQLPSTFKGGQLVVHHDHRTKVFDFSSTGGSANNSFSSFFSAFYCDCEHEILPVTAGYRLCLIYNLIATETEIPVAPQNYVLEQELIRLIRNWEGSNKVVYALTHKYSEASLSFKNLKTSDKIVANILKRVSTACDLKIFLAFFDKDYDSYGGDEDECGCGSCHEEEGDCDNVSYHLSTLRSAVNDEKFVSSNLRVHFKEEVVPADCFDSIRPFQQDSEHTGNEGVHVTRSYRCAAITFWPEKFALKVLQTSNAPRQLIDAMFIKEAEKYFDSDCSAETKAKILEWAKSIVTERRYDFSDALSIVNAIVKFNDIELVRQLMQNGLVRSAETYSVIAKECEKFGWKHFAASTVAMFKHLNEKNALKILNAFAGDDNLDEEKSKLFVALLQATFDKSTNDYRYSMVDQYERRKEERDLLEPLVKAVLKFPDLQLVQNFVKCILPLHLETIPLLVVVGEQNGWEPFAVAIQDKFKKKSKKEQIQFLTSIIQTGILNDAKKALCLNLFRLLFDRNQNLIDDTTYYYNRTSSALDERRKAEKELLEPLINAASVFNDVQLIKNIFQRMSLHSETVPMLIDQSKIYGWNAFAAELSSKFETLSQIDSIDTFSLLIGMGNFREEKMLSFNLFQMILGKSQTPTPSNHLRGEQPKNLKQRQDILYAICCVAENIKFNLMMFAKGQSFKVFVPVLLRLVAKETNRLSPFWGAVALHYIGAMGRESVKPVEISWRHVDYSVVPCCPDCNLLTNFLRSDRESEAFKIGEKRRKHLVQKICSMAKLSHRIENGGRGQMGVLIVTKTEKGGVDALQDKILSKTLLEQLRSVMPYN